MFIRLYGSKSVVVGDLVADNDQQPPQTVESTPSAAEKTDKGEASSESEEVIATDDDCVTDVNKITKVKVLTEADLASYTIHVSLCNALMSLS